VEEKEKRKIWREKREESGWLGLLREKGYEFATAFVGVFVGVFEEMWSRFACDLLPREYLAIR